MKKIFIAMLLLMPISFFGVSTSYGEMNWTERNIMIYYNDVEIFSLENGDNLYISDYGLWIPFKEMMESMGYSLIENEKCYILQVRDKTYDFEKNNYLKEDYDSLRLHEYKGETYVDITSVNHFFDLHSSYESDLNLYKMYSTDYMFGDKNTKSENCYLIYNELDNTKKVVDYCMTELDGKYDSIEVIEIKNKQEFLEFWGSLNNNNNNDVVLFGHGLPDKFIVGGALLTTVDEEKLYTNSFSDKYILTSEMLEYNKINQIALYGCMSGNLRYLNYSKNLFDKTDIIQTLNYLSTEVENLELYKTYFEDDSDPFLFDNLALDLCRNFNGLNSVKAYGDYFLTFTFNGAPHDTKEWMILQYFGGPMLRTLNYRHFDQDEFVKAKKISDNYGEVQGFLTYLADSNTGDKITVEIGRQSFQLNNAIEATMQTLKSGGGVKENFVNYLETFIDTCIEKTETFDYYTSSGSDVINYSNNIAYIGEVKNGRAYGQGSLYVNSSEFRIHPVSEFRDEVSALDLYKLSVKERKNLLIAQGFWNERGLVKANYYDIEEIYKRDMSMDISFKDYSIKVFHSPKNIVEGEGYYGEMRGGHREGEGIQIYKVSNSIGHTISYAFYTGSWDQNLPNGQGEFTIYDWDSDSKKLINKLTFKGEWIKGQML